ncbi:TPA_exp: Calpain-like protein [Trichophyton benhamiae CBS 112371]|nr:TPA_exp: Calpain-like protein [Trichophyton benhamiae CBS 112371]
MSQLRDIKAQALEAEKDVRSASTQKEELQAAINAAEHYMNALRLVNDPVEKRLFDSKCKEYLTLAENIKQSKDGGQRNIPMIPVLQPAALVDREPTSTRTQSNREQIILLENSKLNGFVFPPWSMTAIPDLREFQVDDEGELFLDASDLQICPVQREIFDGWKRPAEILGHHTSGSPILLGPNPMDLVQDVTTDCSVVASLCTGASPWKEGVSQLVRFIQMYPSEDGKVPCISPSGKYTFRLYFNGCYRKVIIDDMLPSSKTLRSLHVIDRNNPTAIWPALVEKAYLKVRGGYDFPGSNSGTDLWVLTGWIPEQVFLHDDELAPGHLWQRITNFFQSGDILLTLGTGKLTEYEENELGLISLHDYAVLSLQERDGIRQMLIKNPWAAGPVWKGLGQLSENYVFSDGSEHETSHPSTTAPGTFWMAFEDVLQNFDNLYLNWNPSLFRYRQDIHFRWDLSSASIVPGCFAGNPQFAVSTKSGGTVWLLLGKHFKTGDYKKNTNQLLEVAPDADQTGFISLYVFEKKGTRVYLADGALRRGPYVDSPNTVMRLEMPPNSTYTTVVSEQSHQRSLYSFSISAFSMSPISINPAKETYSHVKKLSGAWTTSTAGGNAESERYPENPQFQIQILEKCDVNILLEAEDPGLAVHVSLIWSNGDRVACVRSRDIVVGSGDYRRGVALAEKKDVTKGMYTIVCSTFTPDQLGNFTLCVSSTSPCYVRQLPAEGAGHLVMNSGIGVFPPGTDRILAPISMPRLARLKLICRRRGSSIGDRNAAPSPILMTVELGQGPYKEILAGSGDGNFSDDVRGARIESVDLQPEFERRGGIWLVVERIGGPGGQVEDRIEVEILSEERIGIGSWGIGDG